MGIAAKLKKFPRLYYFYREAKTLFIGIKKLRREAVKRFAVEKPEMGSFANYKRELYKHRFSYYEYICYKFWNKNKKQREQYISEIEIRLIYRKTLHADFEACCYDKVVLYNTFHTFVNRKWIYPKSVTFDTFKDFVSSYDCIAKPQIGSHGNGVFVIHMNEELDWQKLYDNCVENNMIVEERLRACHEIEEFHPQSLNTIRVFTISKGNRCELVAAEIRIGVGNSVIDNVSAGGIFAPIDLNTGAIIEDGSDRSGNTYNSHPDSGKVFKGFVIPNWEKFVGKCKAMSTVDLEITFAGWDICVLPNGEIEMIEVNSFPNVVGLQIAYRSGLKPKIRAIGKDVLGYDPIKLIPFWKKPLVY